MVCTDNLLCNMHDKIFCFYDCFSSLLFFLHFLWLIRCEQFHIIFKHMPYQMSISQKKISSSSSSKPSKNCAKLSRCTSWSSSSFSDSLWLKYILKITQILLILLDVIFNHFIVNFNLIVNLVWYRLILFYTIYYRYMHGNYDTSSWYKYVTWKVI